VCVCVCVCVCRCMYGRVCVRTYAQAGKHTFLREEKNKTGAPVRRASTHIHIRERVIRRGGSEDYGMTTVPWDRSCLWIVGSNR
jgi:hypothetical protein